MKAPRPEHAKNSRFQRVEYTSGSPLLTIFPRTSQVSGAGQAGISFRDRGRPPEPAAGSPEITAGSPEPAVGSTEPAVGSREPTVSSSEPINFPAEPEAGSGELASGSGEPAADSGEPAVGSGEPAVGSGEPAVGSGRCTSDQDASGDSDFNPGRQRPWTLREKMTLA